MMDGPWMVRTHSAPFHLLFKYYRNVYIEQIHAPTARTYNRLLEYGRVHNHLIMSICYLPEHGEYRAINRWGGNT